MSQSIRILFKFNNAKQLPVCLSTLAAAWGIPELVPAPGPYIKQDVNTNA